MLHVFFISKEEKMIYADERHAENKHADHHYEYVFFVEGVTQLYVLPFHLNGVTISVDNDYNGIWHKAK